MLDVTLKRFDQADEIRTFEKGKFELIRIGGVTIGRATYDPGWKWSVHVGLSLGKKSCDAEHVGIVISGEAVAAMDDGRVIEMKAGDVFHIAPMTVGWSATSRMCPCIYLAQVTTHFPLKTPPGITQTVAIPWRCSPDKSMNESHIFLTTARNRVIL